MGPVDANNGSQSAKSTTSPFSNRKSDAHGYLPHLDGLRAIALLGVLAFHFDVPHSTGGYLGVDVFLVLSGYLMTRNISRRLVTGRFSLRDFYVSRFWRLYPSSLVMVFFSMLASLLFSSPDLTHRLAESAFSALFGLSNIYFYSQANYFDVDAKRKPLLHTWSLSLEEQYYALWPTFLVLSFAALRKNRRIRGVILSTTVLSYFAAVILSRSAAEFAFFMLPSRIFEFGIGGVAYFYELVSSENDHAQTEKNSQVFVDVSAGFSLLTILSSYCTTPLGAPVYHALPISIAAVTLILTPDSFVCSRILSVKWLMKIGQLAYSLYLVHWPLYVLSLQFAEGTGLHGLISPIVLLCGSGALGLLLNRTVEQRYRLPAAQVKQTHLWRHILVLWMLTIGVIIYTIQTKGMSARVASMSRRDSLRAHISACKNLDEFENVPPRALSEDWCMVGSDASVSNAFATMQKGETIPKVRSVVLGNSFARHILPIAAKAAKDGKEPFLFKFRVRCALQPEGSLATVQDRCKRNHRDSWKLLHDLRPNTTVIIANNWEASRPIIDESVNVGNAIAQLGLETYLFGPPGGLQRKDHSFFACHSLLSIWEYWKFPSYIFSWKPTCLSKHIAEPAKVKMSARLERAAEKSTSFFKFIPTIKETCQQISMDSYSCDTVMTRDGGVVEPVFESDGFHLSYWGAVSYFPKLKKHFV